MRAWSGFGLGAALIAAAYVADRILFEGLREAQATFSSTGYLGLDAVAQVGMVTLILVLAWLVFRGPRSRAAGVAMAILGFYVGLLPQLSFVLEEATGIQIQPPFRLELMLPPSGFAMWAATAVMVLGLFELIRPTAAEAPIRL
jgi:hypothetical protein